MNVDQLRKARKNAPTAYIKFTRKNKYVDINKYLFCFVEGKDGKYYSVRAESILNELITYFISCNGKEEVLRLYEIIETQNEYNDYKLAFFIDRDFDNSDLFPEDIYVSPCHSIENLYTNIDVFRRILRNEFNLTKYGEDDNDFKKCVNIYKNRQKEFHNATIFLNVWISIQDELYGTNEEFSININNINLTNLVNISLEKVEKNYNIVSLHKKYSDTNKYFPDKFRDKLMEFKELNPQKVFRGKFEIEFLRVIINKLISELSKDNSIYFNKRNRVNLNLSRDNIISELSNYAETPVCLKKYLKKFEKQDDKKSSNIFVTILDYLKKLIYKRALI